MSRNSHVKRRFVVVPPNGPAYADPDVLERLSVHLRVALPEYDIEVARVVQPRVETFTVVHDYVSDSSASAGGPECDETKRAIEAELEAFDEQLDNTGSYPGHD